MKLRNLYLVAGPLLFLASALVPWGMPDEAALTMGVVAWMMTWWITEVVPMAITSLLPLVLFPLLGLLTVEQTAARYGNRFVFLFLGGFIIALAMEKWNLHRRLALSIINLTGSGANAIILGFFMAAYLISMWISNTATALMMLPIGQSVVGLLVRDGDTGKGIRNFGLSIMLAIAYGASIGGIATLVGTPPNAAAAGILAASFGEEVSFFGWMKIALPFSLVLLVLGYLLLVRFIYPNRLGNFPLGHEIVRQEMRKLGRWKKQEIRVMAVFALTALLWIFQQPIDRLLRGMAGRAEGQEIFSDVTAGLLAAIALFLLPSGEKNAGLLVWKDTERLPWGVLLMFGGGMALAEAFDRSGLVQMITAGMQGFAHLDPSVFLLLLCGGGLVLTAMLSNITMVTLFIPIVGALALSSGQSPLLFAIPVTIAASCDFMFPMSTPPNAIAYGSGLVSSKQMLTAGIWLNLVSFVLLAALVWFLR
jgi:sodium-dependent dicarboxylate transporter 2/3/5